MRYTIKDIVSFLATEQNAREYAKQTDKYVWTEVLIESNFTMRATETFVNALEDEFDKINDYLTKEYILDIREYDDFSALFANQADHARSMGRLENARAYQASSAQYKAMAMERRNLLIKS